MDLNDHLERQRKSEIKRKNSFEKWLDEPMVRMGMSMIPAGEKQDALKALLQSAFNSGFESGCGDVVSELLEGWLKHKDQPRKF